MDSLMDHIHVAEMYAGPLKDWYADIPWIDPSPVHWISDSYQACWKSPNCNVSVLLADSFQDVLVSVRSLLDEQDPTANST
jgi:hypothetical protein